jgi:hypothetical protein
VNEEGEDGRRGIFATKSRATGCGREFAESCCRSPEKAEKDFTHSTSKGQIEMKDLAWVRIPPLCNALQCLNLCLFTVFE